MTPSAIAQARDGAATHYQGLLGQLVRVRRYLRAVVWVESLVHALVALLVVGPTLFLLDNLLHFSTPLRLLGFLAIVGGGGVAFVASVRIAFQRWSYERLAMTIERRFPDLENRLINAVQLGALDPSHPSFPLVSSLVAETARDASKRRLLQAVNLKGLSRGALVGLGLAVLVGAYAFLLPDYFGNAAMRMLEPGRHDLLPITRILLKVTPGAVTISRGEALTIAAVPQSQEIPRETRVEVDGAHARTQFRMDADGNRFYYAMSDVAEDFKYRVRGGDFASEWYAVRVIEKPRVERIAIRYEYPGYTGLSPAVVDPANGHVTALVGTRVTLTATVNKTPAEAVLEMNGNTKLQPQVKPPAAGAGEGAKATLEAAFLVETSGTYQWLLTDSEKFDNSPTPTYTIQATVDMPPRVAITSRRAAVEVPRGQDVQILYSASDDYGLASFQLRAQTTTATVVLQEMRPEAPPRLLNDGFVLRTDAYAVGTQLRVTAAVTDTNPASAAPVVSEPLSVKIVAPATAASKDAAAARSFLADVMALLERQKALRGDLDKWRAGLSSTGATVAQLNTILKRLLLEQSTLRVDTGALANATPAAGERDSWNEARGELREIAGQEMRAAVVALEELARQAENESRRAGAESVRTVQANVIARLEKLLGAAKALAAVPQEAEPLHEEDAVTAPAEPPRPNTLGDLHGAVLDFIEDQKGLVKTLQGMSDTNPEDLSTSSSQTIENLAKKEEKWADYFKDASEWMRDSAMVESTESGLRDELVEIYNEIHALPEELRHQKETIEVSAENNGVELAQELTTELEKWLAEEPDYQKWVMENSPTDIEVPMADLPDELTDQIGDLLESEQDMTDDIEDMTSNWADSIDKGAGWGASDGPISNYSAKGVTGNLQPNDMDISGRSGEGRTGRSTGEMVESVATGKGGRDTKTRMTDDAMGAGQVEDLSKEQTGGATGGGKVAGTAGFGLVSATAPAQPQVNQKMAQRQEDLKQKAVSLQARLLQMHLPGANLDSSIRAMTQIQKSLVDGRYEALRDLGAVVVSDLRDQKRVTEEQFRVRRDPTAGEPRKMQYDAAQGGKESFPEEYGALLSAYYDALAQGPGQGK